MRQCQLDGICRGHSRDPVQQRARVVLDNAAPEVVKLVEDGKLAVSAATAVANSFETSRRLDTLAFPHHAEAPPFPRVRRP